MTQEQYQVSLYPYFPLSFKSTINFALMSTLGNDHANDHAVIIGAVSIFAATRNINLNLKDNCTYQDNCTYRKTGFREAQPDVSC
ncbi:MAG: hypothetical protein MGG11_18415 [Trichodesmium sp. MAG_R03]|nr:hypothetical protein [Trichodesmium sp. MAG_R03]